jgi:hypothetical protein
MLLINVLAYAFQNKCRLTIVELKIHLIIMLLVIINIETQLL